MRQVITFLLSNFTLTFFVLGVVVALISVSGSWNRTAVAEALLSWFLFFALGVTFLYNFVMHAFFSEMAAGHVLQMVEAHNDAPGNAGIIFYTDILIPAFGFILLWLRYREGALSAVLQGS